MNTHASSSPSASYDVVIIGGGPGGSTLGSLLRKYNPELKVLILEKEHFPRDHVGESQLPPIGRVLHEMGAWDKIEAAGFPVKLGATYTWGKTTEPWVFGFIPAAEIKDTPRPGKYEGWRTRVAMQVDRAIYDDILLKHAASLGCEVRQGVRVAKVHHEAAAGGPRITHIETGEGERITAKHYVDASGNAAIIRRQLGIEVDAPKVLQNIAFWDYWERPGLNEALLNAKTVRIQIRSLAYGWIWYIALSNDRTSVGLVCNAEYYKASGKRPGEIYSESLAAEPSVHALLQGATSRSRVETTTDWSYVAQRAYGPNWFLCGECLGFADPILSAGLTLTHTCAEHLACAILELERGQQDASWLRGQYEDVQQRRVRQHIKFAEYWYSANGLFKDILDNCSKIAETAGLSLSPGEAFRWLSHGGIDDHLGQFAIGGLGLSGVKAVQHRLSHEGGEAVTCAIDGATHFKLNVAGATQATMAAPQLGRVLKIKVLERDGMRLPLVGHYQILQDVLAKESAAERVVAALKQQLAAKYPNERNLGPVFSQAMQSLEAMTAQGWVECERRPSGTAIRMSIPEEGEIIYSEAKGPAARRV
ncbi:MAG: NAD(P)/FAD-dependent oxidoreductase [Phycisphaerales bacterium]